MNFDQVIPRRKTRNPLSTLTDNVPLQQNPARKRTESYTRKSFSKRPVPRSKSTSGVETRFKFPENAEKITVRSTATNTDEDGDDVFVDAQEHVLLSYVADEKVETVDLENLQKMPNFTSRIPMFKKPAEKVTLVEKRNKRLSNKHHNLTFRIQETFANCLYDEDYHMDNYAYMLHTEGKYVFRKSYLTKYVDIRYRILIVNWLINVQENLGLSEISLFVTIRMVDNLLIKSKIPTPKYALVGIACLWIASKMHDYYTIFVSKLFGVCNGKFSKSGILTMEKDVLKALNFNINFAEPLTFLYYYLKNENLEKENKVVFGAMFLLEMFTFLLEFSSTSPSILAAVAVYLVLIRYDINSDAFLRYVQKNLLEECTFKTVCQNMWKCTKEILATNCFKNEVVAKYSLESKFNVVQYFTSD